MVSLVRFCKPYTAVRGQKTYHLARAFGSHPRGRRFDPVQVHQNKSTCLSRCFCFGRHRLISCSAEVNSAYAAPTFSSEDTLESRVFFASKEYSTKVLCPSSFSSPDNANEVNRQNQHRDYHRSIPARHIFPLQHHDQIEDTGQSYQQHHRP